MFFLFPFVSINKLENYCTIVAFPICVSYPFLGQSLIRLLN